MTDSRGSFADRLRRLREAAGLSQYALAKQSGLTKQALSRLELGEREPTWETVQLLAAALDVSCQEFIDPNVRPPAQAVKTDAAPPSPPTSPSTPADQAGKRKRGAAEGKKAKTRKPKEA